MVCLKFDTYWFLLKTNNNIRHLTWRHACISVGILNIGLCNYTCNKCFKQKLWKKIKHNLCPVTIGRIYDNLVTLISYTQHFRTVSTISKNRIYFILCLVPGNRSKFNSKHFVWVKIYLQTMNSVQQNMHISYYFIFWQKSFKCTQITRTVPATGIWTN